MKKIIALAVSLLIALSVSAEFKEGDILWQMSKSKQSPLIQLATLSPWSHCGVVVEKNKKLYVLEASNVVKLTPLQKWIAKGRLKQYKQRRVFRKAVKIRYKQYLGMPYDLAFKFGNGKMYCSELVYDIYKNQFGIELAKPKKVKEYHLWGMSKKLKQRGISKNQLVVSPSDLLSYKHYE